MQQQKSNENSSYLFEELNDPNFEQSFFEQLLGQKEDTQIEKSINNITIEDLEYVGDVLGIDWNVINKEQLKNGIEIETEHKDVVGDDLVMVAKIALAHLKEFPDYYERLKTMERKDFWDLIDQKQKDNIIFFIITNKILPEEPTKRLMEDSLSKMQKSDMFEETKHELELVFDRKEKVSYNGINAILKKMLKKSEVLSWDDEKEDYLYVAKNENRISKMVDYDDLCLLIDNDYKIERIKKS